LADLSAPYRAQPIEELMCRAVVQLVKAREYEAVPGSILSLDSVEQCLLVIVRLVGLELVVALPHVVLGVPVATDLFEMRVHIVVFMLHLLLHSPPLAFLLSKGLVIWVEPLSDTWQIVEQRPELDTSPILCAPSCVSLVGDFGQTFQECSNVSCVMLAVNLFFDGFARTLLLSTCCFIWTEHSGHLRHVISQPRPELSTSPLLCTPYVQVFEWLPDTLMLSL
jgi:hypothetical protein